VAARPPAGRGAERPAPRKWPPRPAPLSCAIPTSVPCRLEEIRLHLADEVLPLWHAVQIETNDPDPALPYWAFAWAGGLAIGRYLRDRPEAVAGRRVFDLASGSGLCAIASMRAGAAEATGADIDAFAAAAIELNARANGRRVTVVRRDVLDEEPPDVRGLLAGDCWYEARLAGRVLPWLRRARDRGIDVLVGDPAAATCPPTSWSSSPRTKSARRPSSRTSTASRAGSMPCVAPTRSAGFAGPTHQVRGPPYPYWGRAANAVGRSVNDIGH